MLLGVFNRCPVAMAIHRCSDGALVEVNPAFAELIGLPPERIVGNSFAQLGIFDPAVSSRLYSASADQHSVREIDAEIRTHRNRTRWVLLSSEPIEIEGLAHALSTLVDVTQRKHAERHVRELNRVYAVLSDINQAIVRQKIPQAILPAACQIAVARGEFRMAWIGLLDESVDPHEGPGKRLRIAAHAGADERTLAIVKELLAGESRSCAFTFQALQKGLHGVCNDIATDPLARPWVNEALERDYLAMAALPLIVRGSVVGTFNLYSSQPGFFHEDEMTLLDELALDISFALELHERDLERLHVEQALRDSELRFRQLADNIEEVFWMADAEHREIFYMSPAYEKIWGRTCAEVFRSPSVWWDSIHPEDRDRVRAATESAAHGGGFDETYRITRPDGSLRWIHGRAFPVRATEGLSLRLVGVAEDVTERRQLEEQYRQAQKMEAVGQLAGGIAHDFNNILLVIRGFASLLMEEDLSAEAAEATGQIAQAAERASNLTRQLLAFSRRQVMQRRPLDLNVVVERLHAMLLRIVGEDVELQVNQYARPLIINADGSLLDQIILNLVVNARDAMPAGGRISIDACETLLNARDVQDIPAARPGRHATLRVSDSGVGIPPQNLPRIFEPFFTTKEAGKGTGLGLATVYGIVAQHCGAIKVSSVLGQGTVFEIHLPVLESASPAAAEPPEKGGNALRGSETILIVEDDPHVRSLTRTVLTRNGYHVLEASRGLEALEVWDRHRGAVDLLLTDMVMPGGMNGRQLADRLRALNPALKVVFTSGYYPQMAGADLLARAGEQFIQKPAPIPLILETIRRSLDAAPRG